ncbi:MAG: hypothetical protein AABX01_08305 [Candidatus Micrarchaeota archaeon]
MVVNLKHIARRDLREEVKFAWGNIRITEENLDKLKKGERPEHVPTQLLHAISLPGSELEITRKRVPQSIHYPEIPQLLNRRAGALIEKLATYHAEGIADKSKLIRLLNEKRKLERYYLRLVERKLDGLPK